jgi:hypothetical protein
MVKRDGTYPAAFQILALLTRLSFEIYNKWKKGGPFLSGSCPAPG